MCIILEPVTKYPQSVLKQMMELYLYDFSEFSMEDIQENGCFGYAYLQNYWTDTDRQGFFIKINEKFGGFVLVRHCCEYHNFEKPHCIAEFFVMKKYRRQGVGKYAAKILFEMFGGSWEVCCWEKNLAAQKFLEKTIAQYTNGNYQTFSVEHEGIIGIMFESNPQKNGEK